MSIIKIRDMAVNKIMGPVVGLILVTLLAGIFVSFGSNMLGGNNNGNSSNGSDNHVALIANGRKLMSADFDNQYQYFRQRMQEANQLPGTTQMAQMKGYLAVMLVNQELEAAAADKAGITVSGREISSELDRLVEERLQTIKKTLGDPKMSDDELDSRLRDSRGIGVDDIRAQVQGTFSRDYIETALLARKFEASIQGKVQLSDAALQDSYRNVTVRQILVSNTSRPDASAKQRAQQILDKLRKGADFATLARQYSDDKPTASKGGLLPIPLSSSSAMWDPYGPDFNNAAIALRKPGDLSGVVKGPDGYHIIQLVSSTIALPKDFAKKKEYYRRQQQQALSQQIWNDTVQKLESDAQLKFSDPQLEGYWDLYKSQTDAQSAPAYLEKAAKAFQQHIADAKDGPGADTSYIELAQIRERQGRLKEAAGLLLQAFNSIEDGQARLELAQIYMRLGEKKKAFAQYKMASEVTADPQVHRQLVQVFTTTFPNAKLAKESEDIVQSYMQRQQATMPQPAQQPASKAAKPAGEASNAKPPVKPGQGDNPAAAGAKPGAPKDSSGKH